MTCKSLHLLFLAPFYHVVTRRVLSIKSAIDHGTRPSRRAPCRLLAPSDTQKQMKSDARDGPDIVTPVRSAPVAVEGHNRFLTSFAASS